MTPVLIPPDSKPPSDVPDVPIYRLTVAQYHDMLRRDPTSDREPVELLEGLLVPKMGEDAIHAAAVEVTRDLLAAILPAGWIARGPHPVTTEDSEPEPDVTVARGTQRDYFKRHPTPADAALVIEVANSSVRIDRGIKQRVYAAAGVPVYWILVLQARFVEVYTAPTGIGINAAYGPPTRYADGDSVPVVIDGREVGTIAVADLLP